MSCEDGRATSVITGQDHSKLVAAKPADRHEWIKARLGEAPGHCGKDLVANAIAAKVVDETEAIEIYIEKGSMKARLDRMRSN